MADVQKPICVLFGANGQLGFELRRTLANDYVVHALDRNNCDLTDVSAIEAVIARHQPQVIVNAAAYTAVDKAESEPEAAHAVNALALQAIAVLAKRINAAVLHFSTDYVFDGSGHVPWLETDSPKPINVYGASKLSGERLLQETMADGQYWIIRTSWVFGQHGNNFLKTMLRLARERDQLSVVDDQVGAPTSAALIAEISARLLRVQPASGIYHLAAAGETSWYGYAQHAIAYARAHGLPIRLADDVLKPIRSADYPTPAARPRNSRLNCSKIEGTLSITLPSWQHRVEQVVDALAEAENS